MRIQIELTGKSPLVMHNERLADNEDKIAREIKAITDKGTNQTDTDRELVSKLEWYGGLYRDGDTVVVPSANVRRSLREAAAITKQGMDVVRALTPTQLNFTLAYDGPSSVDDVFADKKFTFRRPVKIGRGRVIRTRPIFPTWGLVAEFELLPDILSFEHVVTISERAGLSVGLCDGRSIGYGRFSVRVSEAAAAKKKKAA